MSSESFGGWEERDVQNLFEDMFLSYWYEKEVRFDGKIFKKQIYHKESFRGMDKESMKIVIDKIIRFLAEQNIIVKTPEEYYYGKYKTVSK